MDHTLILEIPENLYKPLEKTAQHAGLTLEELAIELLRAAITNAEDDPLEDFIGAFNSTIPDWADQHDHYIGQNLLKEMGDTEDKA